MFTDNTDEQLSAMRKAIVKTRSLHRKALRLDSNYPFIRDANHTDSDRTHACHLCCYIELYGTSCNHCPWVIIESHMCQDYTNSKDAIKRLNRWIKLIDNEITNRLDNKAELETNVLKDLDGKVIEPGDNIRHNYGIPPTTVDLFVFGDERADFLHCIDASGSISTLTPGIAENSYHIE